MYFVVMAVAFMVLAAIGRVTNLRLLATVMAALHLTAGALEPSYLVSAAVEVGIVLAALHWWCHASSAVAKLSIVALAAHLVMLAWYQHPTPYDWFMVAYGAYPATIRTLELCQLLVIVYWLPQVRSLSGALTTHRNRNKEPKRWMEYSREA